MPLGLMIANRSVFTNQTLASGRLVFTQTDLVEETGGLLIYNSDVSRQLIHQRALDVIGSPNEDPLVCITQPIHSWTQWRVLAYGSKLERLRGANGKRQIVPFRNRPCILTALVWQVRSRTRGTNGDVGVHCPVPPGLKAGTHWARLQI